MKAYLPAALYALVLGACTTTRPYPTAPEKVARLEAGTRLAVVPVSGAAFSMMLDEVRNDTLLGYTSERNVKVPLSGVRDLSIKKVSASRTLWVTVYPAAALVTAMTIIGLWPVLQYLFTGK
jgi:hypothetical protein